MIGFAGMRRILIKNCTFKNFLYELGSIIDVEAASSWSVHIENSLFTNMSFCGSIFSTLGLNIR